MSCTFLTFAQKNRFMLKSQYILIGVGVLTIALLSFLPKTVVKNLDKEVAEQPAATNKAASQDSTQSTTPNVEELHNTSLTAAQQSTLQQLNELFAKAKDEKEKTRWLDSIVFVLQSANKYDTAANIVGDFAAQYTSADVQMRAGDAYMGAFQFSMQPQKAQELGVKARGFYEKVLAQQPNNSEAKVKVGLTYVSSPNPMQGILLIREVLSKEPDNQFAIMSLGKLAMQSGQYDKAIERFRRLLELDAENIEAKFLLAVSLLESGKKDEATKLLKELQATTQDPAVKMQVESLLKQQ
jgi:tetratricopeptide (TPR) repeat protein